MSGLVDLENLLGPGDDFVGAGIRGLVEVDHAVRLQHVDGPVQWRVAARQRCEVVCLYVEQVVVLSGEQSSD